MAEIQLKHVYKKYEDQVVAVRDFNLEIKDQEFVIFVGAFRMREIDNSKNDCRAGGDI